MRRAPRGIPLRAALESTVESERLDSLSIEHSAYVGDAEQIVKAAVAAWTAGKERKPDA